MHICKEATMMEATCEGHWHLPNARSIQAGQLQVCLSNVTPPSASRGSDWYQWKQVSGTFTEKFSSKGTWQQIRLVSPRVSQYGAVWFKESVPRFSFIQWLAIQERLTTRDRLRHWGYMFLLLVFFALRALIHTPTYSLNVSSLDRSGYLLLEESSPTPRPLFCRQLPGL